MRKRVGVAALAVVMGFACTAGMAQDKSMGGTAMKKSADATGFSGLYSFLGSEVVSVADAMPADKYDFAPKQDIFKDSWKTDFATPKPARSFADQVKHIAQANYFFFNTGGALPPEVKAIGDLKTKADIMAALKKSFEFAQKQVDAMTSTNAWDAMKIDGVDTTRAGQFAFGMAHMNDHMGQLNVYLRMNGIVPPQSRK